MKSQPVPVTSSSLERTERANCIVAAAINNEVDNLDVNDDVGHRKGRNLVGVTSANNKADWKGSAGSSLEDGKVVSSGSDTVYTMRCLPTCLKI